MMNDLFDTLFANNVMPAAAPTPVKPAPAAKPAAPKLDGVTALVNVNMDVFSAGNKRSAAPSASHKDQQAHRLEQRRKTATRLRVAQATEIAQQMRHAVLSNVELVRKMTEGRMDHRAIESHLCDVETLLVNLANLSHGEIHFGNYLDALDVMLGWEHNEATMKLIGDFMETRIEPAVMMTSWTDRFILLNMKPGQQSEAEYQPLYEKLILEMRVLQTGSVELAEQMKELMDLGTQIGEAYAAKKGGINLGQAVQSVQAAQPNA